MDDLHPPIRVIFAIGVKDRQPYIKCGECGRASFYDRDIMELYCGNCHKFHANQTTQALLPFELDRLPEDGEEIIFFEMGSAASELVERQNDAGVPLSRVQRLARLKTGLIVVGMSALGLGMIYMGAYMTIELLLLGGLAWCGIAALLPILR